MFLFCLPVQLVTVLDAAKRDVEMRDKEIQLALGLHNPAEWTKRKQGLRPLCLHRLVNRCPAYALAVCERLVDALRAELVPQPHVAPDADLVRDLVGRVEQLLSAMGERPRMVRADLPETEKRKVG